MDEHMLKSMCSVIREYAAHMNVSDDDNERDNCTDKIINMSRTLEQTLTEWMFELESNATCKERDGWIPITSGRLPSRKDIVLFSTISGQVFEGFLETIDTSSAYRTEDNKIAFHEYTDGGKWYRYRFADLLPMDTVTAWRLKPESYNQKGDRSS